MLNVVFFVAGDVFRRVLHVVHRAAAEHFGPGRAPLPGSDPAEDLPAGFVLRHHRDGHQPAGSAAGERNVRCRHPTSVIDVFK